MSRARFTVHMSMIKNLGISTFLIIVNIIITILALLITLLLLLDIDSSVLVEGVQQ